MNKILWSDNYNTGIHKIDRQHRSIVELINKLIDYQQQSRKDPEKLHEMLHTLAVYSTEHLDYEEEFLADAGYPDLQEHARKHETYIEESSKILFNAIEEKETVSESALDFLSDWWETHILQEDMEFKNFFGQDPEKISRKA